MAELILRPNSVTAMGEWDPSESAAIIAILGDPDDTHTVYNTNADQSMQLAFADIPEEYSEETFTTITATLNARKGGKGNASTNIKILTDGGDEISPTSLTISTDDINTYTSDIGDIAGLNVEDINALQFYMIGTGSTQAFYQDIWFTLTYTDAPPAPDTINLSLGKINLSQGKVTI